MKRILMSLFTACSLIGTAAAQQQPQPQQQPQGQPSANPAGQWYCEWGFRNTKPGQPASAVGGNFQMIVAPNGSARGEGIQMGSAGQFPFQFQGQVQLNGADFIVSGQQQGGLSFGPSQFTFVSRFLDANNMAFNNTSQAGQVFASQCRRTG